MARHEIGRRCRGGKSVQELTDRAVFWHLYHIAEQCEKTQYWNAIAEARLLLDTLCKLFDRVLKK